MGDRSAIEWTDEQWEEVEVLWAEGEKSIVAIARAFGVSDAAVHNRARDCGWPKRTKKPVPAPPVGEQLGGFVRCPSCHLRTDRDPCVHCSKLVRTAVAGG